MTKVMKIAAISLAAVMFAGCAKQDKTHVANAAVDTDVNSLRTAIEETRAAALQANDHALAARQLAEQNAEKINRVFRKSQLK